MGDGEAIGTVIWRIGRRRVFGICTYTSSAFFFIKATADTQQFFLFVLFHQVLTDDTAVCPATRHRFCTLASGAIPTSPGRTHANTRASGNQGGNG
jgi:hypothetical protein